MQVNSFEHNKAETLLIAGVIVPQLFTFINTGIATAWFFIASLVMLVGLIGYYQLRFSSRRKMAFVLLMGIALLVDIYGVNEEPYFAARAGIRVLMGGWMMWKAITEMIRSKSFEMLSFISSLFLLSNVMLFFPFGTEDNVQMLVLFGSAFTLATLVYYENLWDQFDEPEKKWIIVILLTLLIDVFFVSRGLF